jgi:hypothetical protein
MSDLPSNRMCEAVAQTTGVGSTKSGQQSTIYGLDVTVNGDTLLEGRFRVADEKEPAGRGTLVACAEF